MLTGAVMVHEIWSELPDTELVAVCRYLSDAEALVAVKLDSAGSGSLRSYVITEASTGKQFVRRPGRVEKAA